MRTRTRTIAGHELTLAVGRRYLASRPMAATGMAEFPVSIEDITHGIRSRPHAAAIIEGLDYDRANALLMAFNGTESFRGRIWK